MAQQLDDRIQLVEDHVQAENAHDLDRIMTTFGEKARYEDQPWDEHYDGPGRGASVLCGFASGIA